MLEEHGFYRQMMSIYFDTNFCSYVHDVLTTNLLEDGAESGMKLAVSLSHCLLAAPYLSRKTFFWTYAKELSIPVTFFSCHFLFKYQ